MKVDNNHIFIATTLHEEWVTMLLAIVIATHVAIIIAIIGLRVGVCISISRLIHLLLQLLGINNERTDRLVVLYNIIYKSWRLEIDVFSKGVKLIEFNTIDTELNIDSWL